MCRCVRFLFQMKTSKFYKKKVYVAPRPILHSEISEGSDSPSASEEEFVEDVDFGDDYSVDSEELEVESESEEECSSSTSSNESNNHSGRNGIYHYASHIFIHIGSPIQNSCTYCLF